MSNQLIKNTTQGTQRVYPKTYTEGITDKSTGKTLIEILNSFNMYFLSYIGNTFETRCQVPKDLRREGLWITYVDFNHKVITEWYNSDNIDNETWGVDTYWRQGSNKLIGDISISTNGNWVIDGKETEFKATGDPIKPLLRVNFSANKLQVSYDNGNKYENLGDNPVYTQFRTTNNKLQVSTDLGKTWIDTSEPIAAWFRWINGDTADSVGKIQISRDEQGTWTDLSPNIVNNLYIKGYVATVEALPTSIAALGDIYMVGPTYDESDTTHDYPHYRMWVKQSSGWVDNGEYQSLQAGIVQELGNNANVAPSQKTITEAINIGKNQNNETLYPSNITCIQETGDGDFIYVKLDLQGRIILGIKSDGTIYYGVDIPQQVKEQIEKSLLELQNNLEPRIPDYIDNPEFAQLTLDNDNKLLFGIRQNGEVIFGKFSPELKEMIDLRINEFIKEIPNINIIENNIETLKTSVETNTSKIQKNKEAIQNLANTPIEWEQFSEGTKQLIQSSGGGTIVNSADEEDLTTENNLLKFKNREYNVTNYIGRGYCVLRKNIVETTTRDVPDNYLYIDEVVDDSEVTVVDKDIFDDTLDVSKKYVLNIIYEEDLYDCRIILNTALNKVYVFDGTLYYQHWKTESSYMTDGIIQPNTYFCLRRGYNNGSIIKYNGVTYIQNPTITKTINLLTNDMVNKDNTVFINNYDFELNSNLNIPDNSIIIGDGNIYCNSFTINGKCECYRFHDCVDSYSIISRLRGKFFAKRNDQSSVPVSLNIFDFIKKSDIVTNAYYSQLINFNNIIERIYDSYYPGEGLYNLTITIPSIGGKYSGYILTRPLIIRSGIYLNMNHQTLQIGSEGIEFEGDNYAIRFCTENYVNRYVGNKITNINYNYDINPLYTNNVYGAFYNCNMYLYTNKLKKVFDIQNYPNNGIEGVHDIRIDMRDNSTKFMVSIPATPYINYSDTKRLKNIYVSRYNQVQNGPSTILYAGDGCEIDKCILRGIAIIGAGSYIIKNCLNDSYYISGFNADRRTTVHFIGNYWEGGSLYIRNSNVQISCCSIMDGTVEGIHHPECAFFNIDTEKVDELFDKFNISKSDVNWGSVLQIDPSVGTINNQARYYLSKKYPPYIVAKSNISTIHGLENINSNMNFPYNIGYRDIWYITPNGEFQNLNQSYDNSWITQCSTEISTETANNVEDPIINGVDWNEETFVYQSFICCDESRLLFSKIDGDASIKQYSAEYGHPISIKLVFNKNIANVLAPYKMITTLLINNEKYIYRTHFMKKAPKLSTSSEILMGHSLIKANYGDIKYHTPINCLIQNETLYNLLSNGNYNNCIKIIALSNNNILAYLSQIPTYGTWKEGDEIILTDNSFYKRINNNWIKLSN